MISKDIMVNMGNVMVNVMVNSQFDHFSTTFNLPVVHNMQVSVMLWKSFYGIDG